jgi:arylsulfatase A-like enzyme
LQKKQGVAVFASRFIKTFYLWLGVFSACNLATLCAGCANGSLPEKGWLLYPAAWMLQLPLILVIALPHHAINQILHRLPASPSMRGHWVVSSLILFVVSGIYLASQSMHMELDTFLSWDMLKVAVDDTKQILPDIGQRIGFELVILAAVSASVGLAYVRRYHNPSVQHSGRIFVILCIAIMCSIASSYAFAYGIRNSTASRIRNDVLPTTCLVTSIIDDVLLQNMPQAEAIKGIVLLPQIALNDYLNTAAPESTPNVFFIMLEAISWDHYGFTGYPRRDITPHLDALARNSVIFPRSYATANHSNYSQTSVHSSQYPLRKDHLDQFEKVEYPKVLLFDILATAGYQTAFISAQNEDWQGMKRFIFADTELQYFLHSKDELGLNIGIETKIDDNLVCTRALEYLQQRDPHKPVFLYVNFQRTHFPYDIPEQAPRPYQPCSTDDFDFTFFSYDRDRNETVINKYDNALRYVDQQVGMFIDYLKQNNLYDNSVIIVTSDHGEAFYQHGYPTHSTSLYEDQIRVSTLFKQPGQKTSVMRDDPISLIDINPTILEIMGMPNHPNFQGQPILESPRKKPIYILSHGIIKAMGIIDYPWKYFESSKEPPRLVNLEADPAESTDLSAEHPEKVEALQQDIEHFRQQQLYYYQYMNPRERAQYYPPRP